MTPDELNRECALHPFLREYLNDCGFLALNPEDGEKVWCQPKEGMTAAEIQKRTNLGNALGSGIVQAKMNYSAVVEHLQVWLMKEKKFDEPTAREHACAAARYHLLLGHFLNNVVISEPPPL